MSAIFSIKKGKAGAGGLGLGGLYGNFHVGLPESVGTEGRDLRTPHSVWELEASMQTVGRFGQVYAYSRFIRRLDTHLSAATQLSPERHGVHHAIHVRGSGRCPEERGCCCSELLLVTHVDISACRIENNLFQKRLRNIYIIFK